MSTVNADMTMSLDGFVATPEDGVEDLFDWYTSGPVEVPSNDPRWTFHVSGASAAHLRRAFTEPGALICGRRVFDLTGGWGGNHPLGVPVFVVTHRAPEVESARFTFVTDGVRSALDQARKAAGDRPVSVATPSITQQLLDFFDNLAKTR